jgi:heavy metal sensor kinase
MTVWYAVALSLVLALFGALTYGVVRHRLLRHHDGALMDAATSVKDVVADTAGGELSHAARAALDGRGDLVLIHELGAPTRIWYRSPRGSAVIAAMERNVPADAGAAPHFNSLIVREQLLRMYTAPFRTSSGRAGLIHVADSLGDVPTTLTSLRFSLFLMAPLAALISAATGYWLAGRALAPVDEVTSMAREIEASRLSRRLPVPKARDEISRLIETFNQMISRLETSFATMKRFTADASHELRGPLATMRGAVDVALSRPRDPAEYREVLASVGEDVDRLRAITEDLLVLARADAGRVQMEKAAVRLDVLAGEVVESFRPAAEEQQVGLEAPDGPSVTVLGDERWLRQLVVNLIDNAVKFTSSAPPSNGAAGSVRVEVSGVEGAARLSVADSGPGIPPEALGRIFERFFRADDARSQSLVAGSGLGLAVAAWIVEAHGGSIDARNRPEGGSLFTVKLPLGPAQAG